VTIARSKEASTLVEVGTPQQRCARTAGAKDHPIRCFALTRKLTRRVRGSQANLIHNHVSMAWRAQNSAGTTKRPICEQDRIRAPHTGSRAVRGRASATRRGVRFGRRRARGRSRSRAENRHPSGRRDERAQPRSLAKIRTFRPVAATAGSRDSSCGMVSWAGEGDATSQERQHRDPPVLECVECRRRSLSASGWRGVRVDLPDEDDEPTLAFHCPDCAEREFGGC
jgi:hypothetical protein